MYSIIDAESSFDLIHNEHVASARPKQAKDYFGQSDPGHFIKTIWDTDNLTLLRATQYGGVTTAPHGCYIYHTGNVEVEYYISGSGIFRYPGENDITLEEGDCVCQHLGHPHSMEAISKAPLEFAVIFSGPSANSDRNRYESELAAPFFGGHDVIRRDKHKVLVDTEDYRVELISEGNEKPVCVCLLIFKKGLRECSFCHNADSILLTLSGKGSIHFHGASAEIAKDCSAFSTTGESYTLKSSNDDPLKLLMVFSVDRMNNLIWS